MRLLLNSSSFVHGRGYFDHCEDEIVDFFGRGSRVLFIPYAQVDTADYALRTGSRLNAMGLSIEEIDYSADIADAVRKAKAFFVGGGNTFLLTKRLAEMGLIEVIRDKVQQGTPYFGSSAGSNLACPTIMTTNDMPIVEPPSFNALNLVGFQLSPHYIDSSIEGHMGESRDERIREYHALNVRIVVGLREGAYLRTEGKDIEVKGLGGARIFRRDEEPVDVDTGHRLALDGRP